MLFGFIEQKMQIDYWTPTRYEFPEFEKDEIKIFIEIFEEFDVHKTGVIEKKHLERALKTLGQGFTSQELDQIFELVDKEKSL